MADLSHTPYFPRVEWPAHNERTGNRAFGLAGENGPRDHQCRLALDSNDSHDSTLAVGKLQERRPGRKRAEQAARNFYLAPLREIEGLCQHDSAGVIQNQDYAEPEPGECCHWKFRVWILG